MHAHVIRSTKCPCLTVKHTDSADVAPLAVHQPLCWFGAGWAEYWVCRWASLDASLVQTSIRKRVRARGRGCVHVCTCTVHIGKCHVCIGIAVECMPTVSLCRPAMQRTALRRIEGVIIFINNISRRQRGLTGKRLTQLLPPPALIIPARQVSTSSCVPDASPTCVWVAASVFFSGANSSCSAET